VVLTIPKRLRLQTRFDRKLLGKRCSSVWTCMQTEVQRFLGRDDVVPGNPPESATSDKMPSQARSRKRLSPFAGTTSAAASANSTRLRWADSHVR
jgi:hypothetical protein